MSSFLVDTPRWRRKRNSFCWSQGQILLLLKQLLIVKPCSETTASYSYTLCIHSCFTPFKFKLPFPVRKKKWYGEWKYQHFPSCSKVHDEKRCSQFACSLLSVCYQPSWQRWDTTRTSPMKNFGLVEGLFQRETTVLDRCPRCFIFYASTGAGRMRSLTSLDGQQLGSMEGILRLSIITRVRNGKPFH